MNVGEGLVQSGVTDNRGHLPEVSAHDYVKKGARSDVHVTGFFYQI